MLLKLYNTFTKKEEEFTSLIEEKVTMYTCGPTVYGRPHIGNYASFLMADLLRRWLEASGYEVTHVKNITDVGHLVADRDAGEDKIEKQAKQEKQDPLAIARKYEEQYLADEKSLNMLEPAHRPRATETIKEMIALTEVLVEKGFAYETEDGVYFSVEKFPSYGSLSGNTLEHLSAGARVDIKEEKKHPADFALWKKCVGDNTDHILRWPSPWGEGFPGWHIECSAMSTKFLGEQIDIHTGGEDNIFPHHECEIAQSESASGKQFVRMWLHRRRIDMGKEKMSKSLGNVLSLPDIVEKGYSPLDLRYYFLSVHYRTNLKFSWKGMDDAKKARRKISEWIAESDRWPARMSVRSDGSVISGQCSEGDIDVWKKKFEDAMDSDLNTPAALGVVFDLMSWSRAEKFSTEGLEALQALVSEIGFTFGCFEAEEEEEMPEEVHVLLKRREEVRAAKDFDASDHLRDEIASLGYEVRDEAEGQVVRKT
jgi:cysteinyl-tRNA synthetase